MEYKKLSTLFYESNETNRDAWINEQADYRRSMPSSFDIGLETPNGRLFVAMPAEVSVLFESVLRTERKVSTMMRSVPGIAQQALVLSLVLDEVVNTNAIEDIHSTRKEVKEALNSTDDTSFQKKRFREFAHLYLELGESKLKKPSSPKDIRDIYDRVVEGEVSEDKLPDGKIFRAEGVGITSNGVKVVHKGLEPESKIIEAITLALELINRQDIPEVIAAIASHFIFEYAHPFYDGNGRTGRYLLSLFLSEALSAPTVLSLSRAIAENRSAYYRAFKEAEHPLNKGELTFFVYDMLTIIKGAQDGIIEQIAESKSRLDIVDKNREAVKTKYKLSKKESVVLYALAQHELFGMFGSITLEEVSSSVNLGKQMTRKYIKRLGALDLVVEVSKRPLAFRLSKGAMLDLKMQ